MTEKQLNLKNSIILSNSRLEQILIMVFEELNSKKGIDRDQPFLWSLMHIFSCSQISKLLAAARGLDVELAGIAGAIHDLAIIRTGKFKDHGIKGAPMVEEFLNQYNSNYGQKHGILIKEEIEKIVEATRNHTFKTEFKENKFDELIKDADSLDRFLHGKETYDFYFARSKKALKDMKIKINDII